MARILMVDDEPAQIKVWKLLLEARGHIVESATSLPQAMAQLQAVEPDVMIMDLRLPELRDGVALIQHSSRCSAAKVIVLSGWPQDLEGLAERSLVHRLLSKPVRPNSLLLAISELTSRAAAG